jgi:small-conductance mechanosensitive channel
MSDLWTDFIVLIERLLGISPHIIERLLWTLFAWLIFFLLRFTISFLIHRRMEDIAKRYLLRKSISYFLGFTIVLITFIIWFGNVTGWAAYLGILSAGLAIALQDPVTNIAGWIFITVRKPFVVGDRIQIGEHQGDVIDMRLFQFTLIEIGNWVNADQSTGRIIHIPNGWVFKQSTANYTRGFNFIWNELAITITFESNWEKAKNILSKIVTKHSLLKTQKAQDQVRKAARKYMIHFEYLTPIVWTSVADNGVTLTMRYICEPRTRRSSEGILWEDVLQAFGAAADIDFAYPTTRFYNNISEGKPDAKAQPETPPS